MTSVAVMGQEHRLGAGQGGDVDVSVIIAAYNTAEFIHFAVGSALSQAAPGLSLEVLVIDDASSDATAERVTALTPEGGAVRLISLPANGGPSVARNAGLDAARGTWVAVLDADDRFEPGHLARLVALAERTRADLVLANLLLFDPKLGRCAEATLKLPDPQPHWTAADFVEWARPLTGQIDWGLLKPLFRREFLQANGVRYSPHSRHGEDFLLMVDALRKGGKLVISPEATYRYTARSSGWSRTNVDYGGQIVQAQELLADPSVIADAALAKALAARIEALRRWQARRIVEERLGRRAYGELWHALRSSREMRAEFGRVALSKAARALRRWS
jgi:succinoglycan biosynthesis protein ExoO